jgi:uncharacterized protein
MSGIGARVVGWAQRNMPKREEMEHNRFTGPFARRHELWRFTRRSVPRGVAIGLLVGIFALIPGIQIIGAALLCVPCRGNIPLAALMTFLSNPATTPLILAASIWVGNKIGYHADLSTFYGLYERGAPLRDWTSWLLSDAAPALLIGLFVISTVTAAVGYVVSAFGWRWWIGHKHRIRLAQHARARAGLGSGQ